MRFVLARAEWHGLQRDEWPDGLADLWYSVTGFARPHPRQVKVGGMEWPLVMRPCYAGTGSAGAASALLALLDLLACSALLACSDLKASTSDWFGPASVT